MPDLTEHELWVLRVGFEQYGLTGAHVINQLLLRLSRLGFHNTQQILNSLITKRVLDTSPDGHKIRITDYGLELFDSMVTAQADWEAAGITRVSNLDRPQIVIRAGEAFSANRVLREIFSQAKSDLAIADPYIGERLFDLLDPFAAKLRIQILTSPKLLSSQPAFKTALATARDFRSQYPNCELRTEPEEKLHDRYILWDHSHGYHVGHSLKDLGKKDSQLNLLSNASEHWAAFDARWATANPGT